MPHTLGILPEKRNFFAGYPLCAEALSLCGVAMHTVEIRLTQADLRDKMNAMRMWLDEQRFEPSTFASRANGSIMCISVSFRSANEARAFAAQFFGRVSSLPSAALDQIS